MTEELTPYLKRKRRLTPAIGGLLILGGCTFLAPTEEELSGGVAGGNSPSGGTSGTGEGGSPGTGQGGGAGGGGTTTSTTSTTSTTTTTEPPPFDKLVLIDATTDLPVAEHDPLVSGAVLDLGGAYGSLWNIRAVPNVAVGSVRFGLDGNPDRNVDNVEPYSLGDTAGDYTNWTPIPGAHTITVTAYSGPNGSGEKLGSSLSLPFTVTN